MEHEMCGLLGYYTASCGNSLPHDAAQYPRGPHISSTSRRKPEMKVSTPYGTIMLLCVPCTACNDYSITIMRYPFMLTPGSKW